jgi:hypothetical protein
VSAQNQGGIWDNINDEEAVMKGIQILNESGIKNYNLMCYVLVGFNSTVQQDLYRIQKLDKMGIDPFVMKFRNNGILNHIARWCNRPQLRHSCTVESYLEEKGVKRE